MTLDLSTFGWAHTALSLVALLSGFIVVLGLFRSQRLGTWTAIFMASALATSLTGFGFSGGGFGAAQIIGLVSTGVLMIAVLARYAFHLNGHWRWIYAATATLGLYFLVFFAIAESFKRVPALKAIAPTLSEPAFKTAQLGALLFFGVLAAAAARLFKDPGRNGMGR